MKRNPRSIGYLFEPGASADGFTLIELLVVITIIVVLLALLTPALDKAIYQAELAVCATKLHGIGRGVQTYSLGYNRRYPYREAAMNGSYKPNNVYIGSEFHTETDPDDRRLLRDFISINGHLNDPLLTEVDFVAAKRQSQVEVDYNLWFGWQFRFEETGAGMFKLGDRFSYRGDRFDVLATDIDSNDDGGNPDSDAGGEVSCVSSHPDEDGLMAELVQQDTASATNEGTPFGLLQYVLSRWQGASADRGLIDMNYNHSDGSVSRIIGIRDHVGIGDRDERVTGVTVFNDGAYFPNAKNYIPRAP